jgi:hypothetical protein
MQMFGYCSKFENGQQSLDVTDDWLQEQQTKFNYTKYSELDSGKMNIFRKWNE